MIVLGPLFLSCFYFHCCHFLCLWSRRLLCKVINFRQNVKTIWRVFDLFFLRRIQAITNFFIMVLRSSVGILVERIITLKEVFIMPHYYDLTAFWRTGLSIPMCHLSVIENEICLVQDFFFCYEKDNCFFLFRSI